MNIITAMTRCRVSINLSPGASSIQPFNIIHDKLERFLSVSNILHSLSLAGEAGATVCLDLF